MGSLGDLISDETFVRIVRLCYPFFHYFEPGINATVLDECDYASKNESIENAPYELSPNCPPIPVYPHHLSAFVKHGSWTLYDYYGEYYFHGALEVPLLAEVAKMVNKSVHIYITEGAGYHGRGYMRSIGLVDTDEDLGPYHYNYSFGYMSCTRAAFTSYYFTVMSPVMTEDRSESMKIWKAYTLDVWLLLLFFITVLILVSSITLKELHGKSMFARALESLWFYAQPLIGKGDCRKPFAIQYLFYIVALVPYISFFLNDFFSNLVNVKTYHVEKIPDIWERNFTPFQFHGTYHDYLFKQMDSDPIIERRGWKQYLWDKTTLSAEGIPKLCDKNAFMEDDYKIKAFYSFFKKRFNIKMADEMYYPVLQSMVCFRRGFEHLEIADKMWDMKLFLISQKYKDEVSWFTNLFFLNLSSVKAFESGMFSHWRNQKTLFLVTIMEWLWLHFMPDVYPEVVVKAQIFMLANDIDEAVNARVNLQETELAFLCLFYFLSLATLCFVCEIILFICKCIIKPQIPPE